MITLYEFQSSPYCAKIRAILDFKSLEYRTVEVDYLLRREPRRLSGQSRVPVLVEGDRVVADSTAIAAYLDVAHPEPPLLPPTEPGRARALLLEDWVDETLADNVAAFKLMTPGNAERLVAFSIERQGRPLRLRLLRPFGPLVLRSYARRKRARGRTVERVGRDLRVQLDILDGLLGAAPFLAAESPTTPDFALFGFLVTMEGLDGFDEVGRRPGLDGWYRRMKGL